MLITVLTICAFVLFVLAVISLFIYCILDGIRYNEEARQNQIKYRSGWIDTDWWHEEDGDD